MIPRYKLFYGYATTILQFLQPVMQAGVPRIVDGYANHRETILLTMKS